MNYREKEIANAARSYERTIRNKHESFKNLMKILEDQGREEFDKNKSAFYAMSRPCNEAAKILAHAINTHMVFSKEIIIDDILYWVDGKRLRRFPLSEIKTISEES